MATDNTVHSVDSDTITALFVRAMKEFDRHPDPNHVIIRVESLGVYAMNTVINHVFGKAPGYTDLRDIADKNGDYDSTFYFNGRTFRIHGSIYYGSIVVKQNIAS